VTVLTEEVHNRQIYALTGPEALDRSQVAHEISRVIGRPVTYVPLTDEQFREAVGAFMPSWAVEFFSDSYAEVRMGKTEHVLDTVPRLCMANC
jgi:NAD(P)H dehydrogenase (quinone)